MSGFLIGSLSLLVALNAIGYKLSLALGVDTASTSFAACLAILPWLLGVLAAFIESRLLALPYKACLKIESESWFCAPILVAATMPAAREVPVVVTSLGFLFVVGAMLVRAIRFREMLDPRLADRACLLFLVATFVPGLFYFFQSCSFHDGSWTTAYLRSALLDHDLSLYNEFMLCNARFMYVPHPNDPVFYTGHCFCAAPFFLAGHLLATLLRDMPGVFLDGFSWPYAASTTLAGAVFGMATGLAIFALCRSYFGPVPSVIAAVLAFWADQLIFFTFVWPLYSHAFSIFFITSFLLLWMRRRAGMSLGCWLLWGALFGMAVWCRPQTILFGVIPAAELVRRFFRGPSAAIADAVAFAAGALVCFLPQMLIWNISAGQWIVDAYSRIGDKFFWTRPSFGGLLLSMNHGLFTWTPVVALAIPGFFALHRRDAWAARLMLLATLLTTYLLACYEYPDGGAGFGSRYMTDCLPFAALCIAALVASIRATAGRALLVVVAAVLVYINLSMIVLYHLEMIPHNEYVPSVRELATLLVNRVPRSLVHYVEATHDNENVFARPFLAAVRAGSWSRGVTSLAVFAAVAAAAVAMARGLLALGLASPGRERRPAACLLAAAAGASLYLVACVSPGPGYAHVYQALMGRYETYEAPPSFPLGEFTLEAGDRTREIQVRFTNAVDVLDVNSTLVNGQRLNPWALLARVTATDADGQPHVFDVAYGRQTAEYAAFSGHDPEAARSNFIGEDKAVQHWLTRDARGEYYYGAGYTCRFTFPRPLVVRSLRFDYVENQGRWIVNGVVLARREPGLAKAEVMTP